MKCVNLFKGSLSAIVIAATMTACTSGIEQAPSVNSTSPNFQLAAFETPALKANEKIASYYDYLNSPRSIDKFIFSGIDYLAEAQQANGGWGAGAYNAQQKRNASTMTTDPATSAFAAMALLRVGNTPFKGEYNQQVMAALIHLLEVVEKSADQGPQITTQTGTQPQRKLGGNIDPMMTSQFFSRVLKFIQEDEALTTRVEAGLDKCISKIEGAQQADGSWNNGGWAPVLQSTMAQNSLELAEISGRKVKKEVVVKSRKYQKNNVSINGDISTGGAAGVKLYSFSSNQRANAAEYVEAEKTIKTAVSDNILDGHSEVTEANLVKAGVDEDKAKDLYKAYSQINMSKEQLDNETLLSGFGNNGGEEFLSYMLTSEAMVVTGGRDWEKWNEKMHSRLSTIQNGDGSWSGHHCITSPVFCTAAAVLCLTADRDIHILVGENDQKNTQVKTN